MRQKPIAWVIEIRQPCVFEIEMNGVTTHVDWGDDTVLDFETELSARDDPRETDPEARDDPNDLLGTNLIVSHAFERAGTYTVLLYGAFDDLWIPHDIPDWNQVELRTCWDMGTVPIKRTSFLQQRWAPICV